MKRALAIVARAGIFDDERARLRPRTDGDRDREHLALAHVTELDNDDVIMEARERWRVGFFKTAAGRCPVQEYIDRLSSQEADRVARSLELLQEAGTQLEAPHVRSRTPRREIETARRRMAEFERWAD